MRHALVPFLNILVFITTTPVSADLYVSKAPGRGTWYQSVGDDVLIRSCAENACEDARADRKLPRAEFMANIRRNLLETNPESYRSATPAVRKRLANYRLYSKDAIQKILARMRDLADEERKILEFNAKFEGGQDKSNRLQEILTEGLKLKETVTESFRQTTSVRFIDSQLELLEAQLRDPNRVHTYANNPPNELYEILRYYTAEACSKIGDAYVSGQVALGTACTTPNGGLWRKVVIHGDRASQHGWQDTYTGFVWLTELDPYATGRDAPSKCAKLRATLPTPADVNNARALGLATGIMPTLLEGSVWTNQKTFFGKQTFVRLASGTHDSQSDRHNGPTTLCVWKPGLLSYLYGEEVSEF